eukprot:UN11298
MKVWGLVSSYLKSPYPQISRQRNTKTLYGGRKKHFLCVS